MDIELQPLGREHVPLLRTFGCSVPFGQELVNHLRNDALREQETDISATFIVMSPDHQAIDAFITASNTSIVVTKDIQKELGLARKYVPAVMIDYVGVSDSARGHGYRNIGVQLFDRVKYEAFRMNAVSGVRFVALEVRAGNWGAFRRYGGAWGMKPLPVRPNPPKHPMEYPAPDPNLSERPPDLAPERLIPMIFDLYENYGSYWPRPLGLEQ